MAPLLRRVHVAGVAGCIVDEEPTIVERHGIRQVVTCRAERIPVAVGRTAAVHEHGAGEGDARQVIEQLLEARMELDRQFLGAVRLDHATQEQQQRALRRRLVLRDLMSEAESFEGIDLDACTLAR